MKGKRKCQHRGHHTFAVWEYVMPLDTEGHKYWSVFSYPIVRKCWQCGKMEVACIKALPRALMPGAEAHT